jgi:adenine-specific DNA-methyltransferase
MERPEILPSADAGEDPRFLQEQLITYIGSKRALLPFIGDAVQGVRKALGRDKLSVLDMFSGTGVVARYLKQYASLIIANDLEVYSRVSNECYLSNASEAGLPALAESFKWLRSEILRRWSPGMICELYAPRDEAEICEDDRVFYTRRNATYLDTARQAIGDRKSVV